MSPGVLHGGSCPAKPGCISGLLLVDRLQVRGGSNGKESASSVGELGLIPGLGRPVEKEMATHSSALAWKIPWMEETGRL